MEIALQVKDDAISVSYFFKYSWNILGVFNIQIFYMEQGV